jgi:hypothetical protein
MGLDLVGTVGTKTTRRVAIEKFGQKILRRRWDDVCAGEMERFLQDLAVHFVGVLIVERWKAGQHLVQENAEGPPIYRFGVAVPKE